MVRHISAQENAAYAAGTGSTAVGGDLIQNFTDSSADQEIFYSIIDLDQPTSEIINQIAASLHLQLRYKEQDIPFVPFNEFKRARDADNLFLTASSGSGKSRGLFEVAREIAENRENRYKKIYILNPEQPVKDELKKSKLTKLLANSFNEGGAIILWDNFPRQLTRRNLEVSKGALEIISSVNANRVLVSLDPDYYNTEYKNIAVYINEFVSLDVKYDDDMMKTILREYGEKLLQFTSVYAHYVVDNEGKIAHTLWKNDPIPLIILDYYSELVKQKESLDQGWTDAFAIANELPSSRDYYKNQFEKITKLPHRLAEVEFLYTLKLLYALELDRTVDSIFRVQQAIFGSNPPKNPSQKLDSWIYLSGDEYSIHDVPRQAIQFTDEAKLAIMKNLQNNLDIIPETENAVYALGIYVGQSIIRLPVFDYFWNLTSPQIKNIGKFMNKD